MEGPHGSGGPEPPETIAWLWGFVIGCGFTAFVLIAVWYFHLRPEKRSPPPSASIAQQESRRDSERRI